MSAPTRLPRPASLAVMLFRVAEYLDLGDRLVREAAARKGDDLVMGTGVQDDMRRLSDWMVAHPGTDRMIYDWVFGTDASKKESQ